MNWAYLAGSLAAILALAWLARRLGYGTPPALDEATARQVARDQFMGERFDLVELGDGRAHLLGPDGPVTVQTVGIRFVATRDA